MGEIILFDHPLSLLPNIGIKYRDLFIQLLSRYKSVTMQTKGTKCPFIYFIVELNLFYFHSVLCLSKAFEAKARVTRPLSNPEFFFFLI